LHALGTAPFRAHDNEDDDDVDVDDDDEEEEEEEEEEYGSVFTKSKLLALYVFEVILYFLSSLTQVDILN